MALIASAPSSPWHLSVTWVLKQGFCAAALLGPLFAQGGDWPQFLGPTRDGVSTETNLAAAWPKDGPPLLWQKKIGQGFSGPVVAAGKVVLFHRVANQETIDCLEAESGTLIWSFDYPTGYRDDFGFDEGPRATPAIDRSRIFTYGAEGALTCLDFQSGKKVWGVNARKEFSAGKGFFGIACSPLVEGNAVLLIVGGRDNAGIVAFDKSSGNILWKATKDEASYSSAIAATIHGQRYALCLTRTSLFGVEPASGKVLFQHPFAPPIHSSVSAATPLVIGDLIFLSASYGAGATLLEVNGNKAAEVWASDESLSAHYGTPVHRDGFLYGIHGRTDPGFSARLRCIELKTGKVRWEKSPFEPATLVLAGGRLLILTERGELLYAPASPSGFNPLGRAQILPSQVRAHPALADGRLYARSKDTLVCVNLREKKD